MFSAGFSSEQNERIKRALEGENNSRDSQINLTQVSLAQMLQQQGRMRRSARPVVMVIPTSESVQEATRFLNERLNDNREH
jgi:hypothetical protein